MIKKDCVSAQKTGNKEGPQSTATVHRGAPAHSGDRRRRGNSASHTVQHHSIVQKKPPQMAAAGSGQCVCVLRRSGIEKGKPLLQQYHTACSWQLQLRRQCVQRWYYFGTTPRVRPARRGLTPHCMAATPSRRQLAVALLSTHTGCARHPPCDAICTALCRHSRKALSALWPYHQLATTSCCLSRQPDQGWWYSSQQKKRNISRSARSRERLSQTKQAVTCSERFLCRHSLLWSLLYNTLYANLLFSLLYRLGTRPAALLLHTNDCHTIS